MKSTAHLACTSALQAPALSQAAWTDQSSRAARRLVCVLPLCVEQVCYNLWFNMALSGQFNCISAFTSACICAAHSAVYHISQVYHIIQNIAVNAHIKVSGFKLFVHIEYSLSKRKRNLCLIVTNPFSSAYDGGGQEVHCMLSGCLENKCSADETQASRYLIWHMPVLMSGLHQHCTCFADNHSACNAPLDRLHHMRKKKCRIRYLDALKKTMPNLFYVLCDAELG